MRNVKPETERTAATRKRGQAAPPAPVLRTPAQAREDLEAQGISIAQFARDHRLPYGTVYQVLTGDKKGRRGDAHRAAVLLRLKAGVIPTAPEVANE